MLLLTTPDSYAVTPPGLPTNLTVGLVGNPLAVPPKLQLMFRNTTVEAVGFELEATANGEVVTQPYVNLRLHCVTDRTDWACALDPSFYGR
ncbi:MAG: hypothetical protein ACREO9_10360 [Lysobacterales bacterium]